jgi:hypothetical protein
MSIATGLRRLVALLQALFAVGCLELIVKLVGSGSRSGIVLTFAGGLALLAALGLWAAVAMWRGKPAGAVLTLALQVIHIIYMETASLTIAVSLPLAVVVGLDQSFHPHSWLRWKPSIEITVESLDQSPWVGINLLALLSAVVAIYQLKRALSDARPGSE